MAFTEFYCQSGGSNLNGGSDTGNTAKYTSTNGNWNGSTTFTPSDTQAASLIAVGDFASVYLDGASIGVYIARVVTVNSSGGNITSIVLSSSSKAGSAPTSGATGRTIKVGGAWQGPNGTSFVPLTLAQLGNAVDASSHRVRINLKNNATYSLTTGTSSVSVSNCIIQGYSSSPGDLGKAVLDGGTSTGGIINGGTMSNSVWADIEFKTSITTGSADLFNATLVEMFRCVFHGARAAGVNNTSIINSFIECEFYNNNTGNNAGSGSLVFSGLTTGFYIRDCYIHDNTGSNNAGIVIGTNTAVRLWIDRTVFDSNTIGISIASSVTNAGLDLSNCDFYNHSSDAIKSAVSAFPGATINAWNTNFVKNTGARINVSAQAAATTGYLFNCGSGSGTQANGSDTLGSIVETGTVTYASGVTPWNNPASGDFSITLAAAMSTGRGFFTETDGTNSGTVGYPDIGAAPHQDTTTTPSAVQRSYVWGG